eukprot:2641119-Prymnesium_polylepis.1
MLQRPSGHPLYPAALVADTVVPRLLRQPTQWFVLAVYGVTAFLTRIDTGAEAIAEELDLESFSGAGTMVTFMIIFYVGYCYNRQQVFFDNVQKIMMTVQNACGNARILFNDRDATLRLWRHLNLLHVSAYT